MMNNSDSTIIPYEFDNTINVYLHADDVWMTHEAIAQLFEKDVSTIQGHVKSLYEHGGMDRNRTYGKFQQVRLEGKRQVRRELDHFSHDVVIAIGFRVNHSVRAIEFREWATTVLRDVISTGYHISNRANIDEVANCVRTIRTSEQHLHKKIVGVFAMSSDYDKTSSIAQEFFATIQNKFHYAIHGHTASELILDRINPNDDRMGLVSLSGKNVTLKDATVAKNYLTGSELKQMQLLADQFLSFAELLEFEGRQMTMTQWANKLNEFIVFNNKQLLTNKGTVSRQQMEKVVRNAYGHYKQQLL